MLFRIYESIHARRILNAFDANDCITMCHRHRINSQRNWMLKIRFTKFGWWVNGIVCVCVSIFTSSAKLVLQVKFATNKWIALFQTRNINVFFALRKYEKTSKMPKICARYSVTQWSINNQNNKTKMKEIPAQRSLFFNAALQPHTHREQSINREPNKSPHSI